MINVSSLMKLIFCIRTPPSPQINEVLPVHISAVQCLDSFRILEERNQILKFSPGTLSHQRLQQKLLVSHAVYTGEKWLWMLVMGSERQNQLKTAVEAFAVSARVWLSSFFPSIGWWTCELVNYFSQSRWHSVEMSRACLWLCSLWVVIGVKKAAAHSNTVTDQLERHRWQNCKLEKHLWETEMRRQETRH